MTEKFKWGIIGTGAITNKFTADLANLPDAVPYAVGSRSQASADTFAEKFSMPKAYKGYEAVMADPDVDAIYIGTPHPFHKENTIACLEAGKPVLCEKPFAINSADAIEMVNKAREKGVFLMEAMWTRFLPVQLKVQEWLKKGEIGDVLSLTCDFGFRTDFNPEGRLFNPELGGGALLDVGIYTISYASMVFGQQPEKIHADAFLGKSGVDEQNAQIFTYADGQQAILSSAIRIATEHRARISGTQGSIVTPNFWHATEATITNTKGKSKTVTGEYGYQFEAAEVANCVKSGKLESDRMPLDETIAIMQTLDSIRAQIGLSYPME
ncbi:MAG: Gfo/Idh/MocA family oxidoreductase [Anaerolineae bacterium]|jgi:predicted dehydrogenase|nr:Gfo/Idh/MocA family oxidoreductase [Anaerolineae bacterium]